MKNNFKLIWIVENLKNDHHSRQIEEFIIHLIETRKLVPGDRLLSYRAMAKTNHIGENAVRKAYVRLRELGWITPNHGSGTFVYGPLKAELPILQLPGFGEKFPMDLPPLKKVSIKRKHGLSLPYIPIGMDFPNPNVFLEDRFSDYYKFHRKEIKNISQAEFLSGYEEDYFKNAVIKDFNANRGYELKSGMLHIIKGRKSCLDRVFSVLLPEKGLTVVNTAYHDYLVETALRKKKAKVITIYRDGDDFISRIELVLKLKKVRFLFIKPLAAFPGMGELSVMEKAKLLELAKKYQVCLVEEDEDHEVWLGEKSDKALVDYDHEGFVVYLAAFSKITSEMRATRLVVASSDFIARLAAFSGPAIKERNIIAERAMTDMILNGDLTASRKRMRNTAKKDMEELHLVLTRYLSAYCTYTIPKYGFTFWLIFSDFINLNLVMDELKNRKINVPYYPERPTNRNKVNVILLGYGSYHNEEAEIGAKMLRHILDAQTEHTI